MGDKDFSTGIFDFTDDIPGCIVDACICPGCTLATQEATLEGTGKASPVKMVIYCIFSLCCNYIIRGKIRKKYGLKENSIIPDCIWMSWPCGWCGLHQMIREMKSHGDKPCQFLMGDK